MALRVRLVSRSAATPRAAAGAPGRARRGCRLHRLGIGNCRRLRLGPDRDRHEKLQLGRCSRVPSPSRVSTRWTTGSSRQLAAPLAATASAYGAPRAGGGTREAAVAQRGDSSSSRGDDSRGSVSPTLEGFVAALSAARRLNGDNAARRAMVAAIWIRRPARAPVTGRRGFVQNMTR